MVGPPFNFKVEWRPFYLPPEGANRQYSQSESSDTAIFINGYLDFLNGSYRFARTIPGKFRRAQAVHRTMED